LHREKTRHGKQVWVVRRNGKRRQIKAEYGTPEFEAEYRALVDGLPKREKAKQTTDSLAWLITRYRETTAWTGLSLATRRQRENIFRHVIASGGNHPFARITSATITAGCDRRASTPAQAENFLKAMRGLFRWATKAQIVKADPTAAVDAPRLPKSEGFPPWSEEDVARYEARWQIGTRQRVWLDVLLYTGLRRGDAARLGRQHVNEGVATIKTEKTGTEVMLPILPALATTLAAGPCGDLSFIVGESGKPLTKESFGNLFRDACREAGVPGSAHGLRKIAATRAANNGATVAELEAIFGWSGGRMASHYTRAADRRRLSSRAMHKLAGTSDEHSIVLPIPKVRQSAEKEH
jgi:integrase